MTKMIASIDFQIDKKGKTETTVHCRGGITTFSLPLRQATNKAMEMILEEFDSFKEKSTCSCGKVLLDCPQ